MDLATISPGIVKRTLQAFRSGKQPPRDLFDLRQMVRFRSSPQEVKELQLHTLLHRVVWENLAQQRSFLGLPHLEEPFSKSILIQDMLTDFQQGSRELEAWSALYHFFLSNIRISAKEIAQRVVGSNKGAPRHFHRRREQGVKLLTVTLRKLEEKAIDEIWAGDRLPAELDPFIGREKEIAEIKRRLKQTRLDSRVLTLIGSGGCGKTRLALRVARELTDEFEDHTWWVALDTLGDGDSVLQKLSSIWAIRQESNRTLPDTLINFLRPKKMLIVLDNCEHLIEFCVKLVETLLRECPYLRILATSREALQIKGEKLFPVRPLSHPDPSQSASFENLARYEAVQLLIERATAVRPDFALTARNAPIIAQICKRLDGIPLAIELAAARMKILSIEQIAARLNHRFSLLTGGSRAALPRHQTLQATMDWSYDLLNEAEQVLFRRLAVFAGGFTLQTTESVCKGEGIEENKIFDLLAHLIDKSLVIAEPNNGETSYRMLETIREYARIKLKESGEETTLHRRHRDWYLELVERAEPELQGQKVRLWLDRLEQEHDNLRVALKWCRIENAGREMLRLAGALWQFWENRGHVSEGLSWLEEALSVSSSLEVETPHHLATWRIRALRGAGSLAYYLGKTTQAQARFREMLDLCQEIGDKRYMAYALCHLADIEVISQVDSEKARKSYEEARSLFSEVGDKLGMAFSLSRLGNLVAKQGEYQKATSLLDQSLALHRETGDRREMAWLMATLGRIARDNLGNYDRAIVLFAESRDVSQELGNEPDFVYSTLGLGRSALYLNDCSQASVAFSECQIRSQKLGDKRGLAISLMGIGEIEYYCHHNPSEAEAYYKQSLDLYRELENMFGIAWALSDLADAACALHNYDQAKVWQQDSLEIRRRMNDRDGIAYSLEGLAYVASGQGLLERSARLLGAAETQRADSGFPLPTIVRTHYEPDVASIRAQLGEVVSSTAWTQGRAMTMGQAVAYALEEGNLTDR